MNSVNEVTVLGDVQDEDIVRVGDLYRIEDVRSLFWHRVYIVSKIIDDNGCLKYALVSLLDGNMYDIGYDATKLINKVKSSINIIRIARCGQAKITVEL